MSPADIVIALVVLAIFALCVRSWVRSSKAGECVGCSHGGSCSSHSTGHCELSEDIVANAAAAAERVTAKRGDCACGK